MKIGIAIVWLATILGIAAMRKIEPHNWAYPVYAVMIAVLVTISGF